MSTVYGELYDAKLTSTLAINVIVNKLWITKARIFDLAHARTILYKYNWNSDFGVERGYEPRVGVGVNTEEVLPGGQDI